MKQVQFSEEELSQMNAIGISEHQVRSQIAILKTASSFLTLDRPCTIGDGITTVSDDAIPELTSKQREAAHQGRFMEFVPASGAATRMFKTLLSYSNTQKRILRNKVQMRAHGGDAEAQAILEFMDNIKAFPFFGKLSEVMRRDSLDVESLIEQGDFSQIIEYTLTAKGLNCLALPKGLLAFHWYDSGPRTAIEEHLVEASQYIRDAKRICRLHFTTSPEHKDDFLRLIQAVRSTYERVYRVKYDIEFSVQKPSTNTIAADMNNRPFRNNDGTLLFRPGGHGSLIENLNELDSDLIYIKNIDNVVPDHLKADTILWKRTLGGYLIEVQEKVFSYLRQLKSPDSNAEVIDEAFAFTKDTLLLSPPKGMLLDTSQKKREFLVKNLCRPLRVCGVVQNVGEPGGGPFWVKMPDGSSSLQIVESAQVDMAAQNQQDIWNAATHFNPVDLVCGVRDFRGSLFDLERYVDHGAVFISRKSRDGRDLKALELPGLWNGAMAYWNTIFVEVPITTFNPVKTVNSLLRREHQPG